MKLLLASLFIFFLSANYSQAIDIKINGVALVSPPSADIPYLVSLKYINADWVAIIPYAFMRGYTSNVIFDTESQWWGERPDGIEALIRKAKTNDLKIMIKPHLWISGDGWAGDFTLKTEMQWLQWEKSYTEYILTFSKLAEKYQLTLFCIGTELRQVVKYRPKFWLQLIKNIREVYSGQLTYDANWDNYHNVTFWNKLDFIGIDCYFPLSNKKTPEVNDLKNAWNPIKTQLKNFSTCHQKPVLFTEFGYTSSDYCVNKPWSENYNSKPNQRSQATAYQALFESFWEEKWFSGGFIWKWHLQDRTKRNYTTNFTPQGKMASKIIEQRYKK